MPIAPWVIVRCDNYVYITNCYIFKSHVCVLQTLLSLSAQPNDIKYTTYILADGISSCNSFEVPIAIARLRQEGGIITTSESIAFQLMGDAASPHFKSFSKLVKEEKNSTKMVGEFLLQGNEGTNPGNIVGIAQNIKSVM